MVKPKKEDNMKIVKVTSKEELEKLEKSLMKNWNLLKQFGTVSDGIASQKNLEQKIKVLRKLNELLIFSVEPTI
ncbi:MAG: hypothetical protein ACLTZM_20670 [Ruminococcus sp.]